MYLSLLNLSHLARLIICVRHKFQAQYKGSGPRARLETFTTRSDHLCVLGGDVVDKTKYILYINII